MASKEDLLSNLATIHDSIKGILADIKANTSKDNQQTTDSNFAKLKEIQAKLQQIKVDITDLFQPKPTKQNKLFNYKKM